MLNITGEIPFQASFNCAFLYPHFPTQIYADGEPVRRKGSKKTTPRRNREHATSKYGKNNGNRRHDSTGGSSPKESNQTERKTTSISEFNILRFRIVQKLERGYIKSVSNCEKLNKLIADNKLPKGLTPKRFPLNVSEPSLELHIRWDEAHVPLTKTLMLLTLQHWETRRERLKKDTQELRDIISDTTPEAEKVYIFSLLDKYQEETRLKIKKNDEKISKTPGLGEQETPTT